MLPKNARSLEQRNTEASERNATLVAQQAEAAALLAANSAILLIWIEIKNIVERIAVKLEEQPGPP